MAVEFKIFDKGFVNERSIHVYLTTIFYLSLIIRKLIYIIDLNDKVSHLTYVTSLILTTL